MKVLERVVERLIRKRDWIDEMQCGFVSGRGTTDAILLCVSYRISIRVLTSRFTLPLSTTGCHLVSKAQTRNSRVVGASGLVNQGKSRRWIHRGFGVELRVHKGSVLSPLIFIPCVRGSIHGVPHRLEIGATVCR